MKVLRIGCVMLLTVLVLRGTVMAKEKPANDKVAKKAAKGKTLVAPGATVKKMVGDLKFTEGPAGDAAGDLYFSDISSNRILRWSLDGKLSTFREDSGGTNGLYVDKKGNLFACQGTARRLVSIAPEGELTVLADRYNGKRFNSPNDLWIDSKGGVYFSDPRYGNREGMEQDGEHVYYLTPSRKKVIRVISDMIRPNGLIGTPDGRKLYVADHGAGETYVYTINKDGTLTNKQLFAKQGSDGMTLDSKGNVYLTGKTVSIYDRKGAKIEEISIPEQPANVTFAGRNDKTLFITARTSLYAVDMQVQGAPTPIRAGGQKAPKPKVNKEAAKPKEAKPKQEK